MKMNRESQRIRRKKRVRKKVFGTSERPRLSVFKSAKHIYAQIIDDSLGVTLVSAGTIGKQPVADSGNVKGAARLGEMIAEKAKAKKIKDVVFDRGGFKYHGRIKAMAEAAREKGLKF